MFSKKGFCIIEDKENWVGLNTVHGSMRLMRLSFFVVLEIEDCRLWIFIANKIRIKIDDRKYLKEFAVIVLWVCRTNLISRVEIHFSSQPLDRKLPCLFDTLQLAIKFLRLSACHKSFLFLFERWKSILLMISPNKIHAKYPWMV